jgi:hypothetical protein
VPLKQCSTQKEKKRQKCAPHLILSTLIYLRLMFLRPCHMFVFHEDPVIPRALLLTIITRSRFSEQNLVRCFALEKSCFGFANDIHHIFWRVLAIYFQDLHLRNHLEFQVTQKQERERKREREKEKETCICSSPRHSLRLMFKTSVQSAAFHLKEQIIIGLKVTLTFWRRNFLLNFSTPCV